MEPLVQLVVVDPLVYLDHRVVKESQVLVETQDSLDQLGHQVHQDQ